MRYKRCQVLCADDHEDTCSMLSALLRAAGCEVTTAGGVEAAKQALGEGQFSLAVLDNWFADGSGVELCAWLRRQAPDTPVILYSAVASEKDRAEGVRAGAAAYVFKPDVAALLAAVNGLLEGEGRAATNTA